MPAGCQFTFSKHGLTRPLVSLCHNKKDEKEAAMRQFMMTVMALAALGAMLVTAQAEKREWAISNQKEKNNKRRRT
jgi:hypothetical protein